MIEIWDAAMGRAPWLRYVTWGAIWLLTRALMLVQVGYWNDATGTQFQDVEVFRQWSDHLAQTQTMPDGDTWQYPPLVAFMLLLPRVTGGSFPDAFVAMMLIVDLIGLLLLALLARRERSDAGVWLWLLLLPVMGALPLLRFDLVPTVVAIAALLALQTRSLWFGALVGVGAMLKVWPLIILLAEPDRRRLARATMAVVVVTIVVFVAAQIVFGDQTGFFSNQGSRGLQVEAVVATPWQLRQAITGEPVFTVLRSGTNEVGAPFADTLAQLLKVLTVLAGLAAIAWWLLRDRAIRRDGATGYLTSAACGRDVVFTVVLASIVLSRVLSPQFLIWLIGLGAVVLSTQDSRLRRPAWIVAAAIVLFVGIYTSPATLVLRNGALVFAAIDAAAIMASAVRTPSRD